MKEIQKTKEHVEYITVYQANDGTEFQDREECERYEQTARAVLRTRFLKLVVMDGTECTFFSTGSDENPLYAVKMHSQEDVDTVLQLYYLDNPYILENKDYSKKRKEEVHNLVTTAYEQQDILFVGENCDEYIYLVDTRLNIVNRMLKIDKPKEEHE